MIIKESLAKLLCKQNFGRDIVWEDIEPAWQAEYLKDADEIIELFTDAINNGEFGAPKHYHEKINSAFVFPPCKSYKGEFRVYPSHE